MPQEFRPLQTLENIRELTSTRLAVLGSTLLAGISGGMIEANFASAQAPGGSATTEQVSGDSSTAENCPQPPSDTTKPYQGCWPPFLFQDSDLQGCQSWEVGKQPGETTDKVAWVRTPHMQGNKVSTKEGIYSLRIWNGRELMYKCQDIEDAKVAEQISIGKTKKNSQPASKMKFVTVHDNVFDGYVAKVFTVKENFKLTRKPKAGEHGWLTTQVFTKADLPSGANNVTDRTRSDKSKKHFVEVR
jgi:hypothetical protein